MLSERFYGGIGEKSIGYPKKSIEYFPKVYRLFSNVIIQTPGRYGSNDLIALEERFVSMGEMLRPHRTTAPIPL